MLKISENCILSDFVFQNFYQQSGLQMKKLGYAIFAIIKLKLIANCFAAGWLFHLSRLKGLISIKNQHQALD
ncbi:hypothetical protein F5ESL0233_02185 [Lactobacillus sp. ESL0233]|uniref:Uncharacterized protein n=1 Tax=Lactobacillus bombicola TaxID=1505723 RepID=A0ABX9LWV6_9LACO|nr:hypothetical protein DS834_00915 [Lactobacillus bombicola]RMC40725.1 hypothetical protein F5ESL0237_02115 [Lactobacillus sp. ESL0237]RMC42135.1 hypothetical protein F5ESL0233_02185 [Lactobacillus sp. ESL0233]RMC46111.1 hypothetical protein F5ESL0230_02320 [Lactobacillus sp. ESL0230]